MQRKEIEEILKRNDSTVLSFPDRGPWGSNRYRGNTSGFIHAFLIFKYKVCKMAELFSGSATGYDVCADMGIKYVGADINPTPMRPGILTVNAITDEVPEEFYDADMIFMHPPYSSLINISYCGSEFPDPTGELSKYDLGQMPWPGFMRNLNEIVMKYYAAMETGARMSILMGDIRRQGHLYSMFADVVKPGELEQIIIKCQNNCMSDKRTYSSKDFVPIAHEYIMVVKKMMPYIINFNFPKRYECDIRDSGKGSTWRDVVAAVIRNSRRPMKLSEIYDEIEGHRKCETNMHWKEKIRQILQTSSIFERVSEGVWTMAG